MKITWEPEANEDLINILDYISEDNIEAAINQVNEIEKQVGTLSDKIARKGTKGRVRGTMELVVLNTPYIAVYRIKNGPSLLHVGSPKSSLPAIRYAMLIRFFVVLYPRALRLAA